MNFSMECVLMWLAVMAATFHTSSTSCDPADTNGTVSVRGINTEEFSAGGVEAITCNSSTCNSTERRAVCQDGWDEQAAMVLCRQLLGPGGYAAFLCNNSCFGETTLRGLDGLSCTGNESSLLDCQHTNTESCPNGQAGVLCCRNSSTCPVILLPPLTSSATCDACNTTFPAPTATDTTCATFPESLPTEDTPTIAEDTPTAADVTSATAEDPQDTPTIVDIMSTTAEDPQDTPTSRENTPTTTADVALPVSVQGSCSGRDAVGGVLGVLLIIIIVILVAVIVGWVWSYHKWKRSKKRAFNSGGVVFYNRHGHKSKFRNYSPNYGEMEDSARIIQVLEGGGVVAKGEEEGGYEEVEFYSQAEGEEDGALDLTGEDGMVYEEYFFSHPPTPSSTPRPNTPKRRDKRTGSQHNKPKRKEERPYEKYSFPGDATEQPDPNAPPDSSPAQLHTPKGKDERPYEKYSFPGDAERPDPNAPPDSSKAQSHTPKGKDTAPHEISDVTQQPAPNTVLYSKPQPNTPKGKNKRPYEKYSFPGDAKQQPGSNVVPDSSKPQPTTPKRKDERPYENSLIAYAANLNAAPNSSKPQPNALNKSPYQKYSFTDDAKKQPGPHVAPDGSKPQPNTPKQKDKRPYVKHSFTSDATEQPVPHVAPESGKPQPSTLKGKDKSPYERYSFIGDIMEQSGSPEPTAKDEKPYAFLGDVTEKPSSNLTADNDTPRPYSFNGDAMKEPGSIVLPDSSKRRPNTPKQKDENPYEKYSFIGDIMEPPGSNATSEPQQKDETPYEKYSFLGDAPEKPPDGSPDSSKPQTKDERPYEKYSFNGDANSNAVADTTPTGKDENPYEKYSFISDIMEQPRSGAATDRANHVRSSPDTGSQAMHNRDESSVNSSQQSSPTQDNAPYEKTEMGGLLETILSTAGLPIQDSPMPGELGTKANQISELNQHSYPSSNTHHTLEFTETNPASPTLRLQHRGTSPTDQQQSFIAKPSDMNRIQAFPHPTTPSPTPAAQLHSTSQDPAPKSAETCRVS